MDWNFKDCIEVQENKKKVVVLCPRFPNYVKFGIFSRRVTAKKCTKKCDARAKLLFCQSKPLAFLPFSLISPSFSLRLLNI